MNQMSRHDPLDDFFRGFLVRPVEMSKPADTNGMKVDVREQEKAYLIHAEMPGIKKDDIYVGIEGPVVSISAERKEEKVLVEGERVLRAERSCGKVSRSFQLGQDIDESLASASYVDGVLELILPKKAATQSKRLTIN